MIMKKKFKNKIREISNFIFIYCFKYFYFKLYIDFGC